MSTTENLQGRTPEDLEALIRRLQKENDRLKSEKNRVGISFRRVPESGAQIKALYDERFPYFEHVPEHSYTLADRHADEEEDGKELSQPTDGNTTLIEAENLAALSALQLTHQGKVDVIYIDPPYNTGNKDFVYNDARTSKIEDAVDDEGKALSVEDYEKTLDGNVRSVGKDNPERHSLWLSFMEKRLWLAKQLLSDEGVIFVSIDDNEQARLKLLMDEVFGEENFVANVVTQMNPRGRQSSNFIAESHEYLLVYKKTEKAKIKGMALTEEQKREYSKTDPSNGKSYREIGLRLRGGRATAAESPTLHFPLYVDSQTHEIFLEDTDEDKTLVEVIPKFSDGTLGTWRWSKKKISAQKEELIARKVRRNGTEEFDIFQKDYLSEDKLRKHKTVWFGEGINSDIGQKEVVSLLGKGRFDYPKPSTYIQKIISMSSNPNAIILDFFAGSGTTAHAVAELNKEDGGNRQCILVTHGDENGKNIAEEVTAQRMKRVLSGKNWADGKEHESLPGELNYYRLQFAEKVLSNYHAADIMRDKFLGYVALEQDVVLSKDQLDEEGFYMLSSSRKNVAVVSDDFLLMDGSLDELMSEAYVEGKENLIYLPLADDTDINEYVPEGWTPIGFPVSYMDSYKSLISLMKSNKTLLQPVSESE